MVRAAHQHRVRLAGRGRARGQGQRRRSASCCRPATRRRPSPTSSAGIREQLVDRRRPRRRAGRHGLRLDRRHGAIAADAGATVHAVRSVRPDLGGYAGKGEAIWKSQFVTRGDVLVFVDADLTEWGPHFVTGLLGPMLTDPSVLLAKGFYDRVLDDGSGRQLDAGRPGHRTGRAAAAQPAPSRTRRRGAAAGGASGRSGATCSQTLSVPVGYGVDIAALLDVATRHGLDADRAGRPRPTRALAPERPRSRRDGRADHRDRRPARRHRHARADDLDAVAVRPCGDAALARTRAVPTAERPAAASVA